MGSFEDGGLFDPDAGESVDVEEPTIVHVAGRHAPERQAIGLLLQETMKRSEAFRPSAGAVQDRDRVIQRQPHVGLAGQRLQPTLQPLAG